MAMLSLLFSHMFSLIISLFLVFFSCTSCFSLRCHLHFFTLKLITNWKWTEEITMGSISKTMQSSISVVLLLNEIPPVQIRDLLLF